MLTITRNRQAVRICQDNLLFFDSSASIPPLLRGPCFLLVLPHLLPVDTVWSTWNQVPGSLLAKRWDGTQAGPWTSRKMMQTQQMGGAQFSQVVPWGNCPGSGVLAPGISWFLLKSRPGLWCPPNNSLSSSCNLINCVCWCGSDACCQGAWSGQYSFFFIGDSSKSKLHGQKWTRRNHCCAQCDYSLVMDRTIPGPISQPSQCSFV